MRAEVERFSLKRAFRISRGTKTCAEVVVAKVTRNGHEGRGECVPYARYGETTESVVDAIEAVPDDVSRVQLQAVLPPGAARNAVDCALWDLEAKAAGRRVWDVAGLPAPRSAVTAMTVSLGAPEVMRAEAASARDWPLLKIKLGGAGDLPRLQAVREGAPKAALIVDANEGWTVKAYTALVPHLVRLGVTLVEQPFAVGDDGALKHLPRPVPVCADESVHVAEDLPRLRGLYDAVNVKLDKAGGLTAALALRDAAQGEGFGVMVGCMVGSSLGMAPATLLMNGAMAVDLDGPLWLSGDRANGLVYERGCVYPPEPELWG